LAALVAAAGLVLAACGSNTETPPSTPVTESSTSVTVTPTTSSAPSTTPAPTTEAPPPPPPPPPAVNALTGLAPSDRPVVAVKIDNTFSGRQWGLAAADIVYVQMVEGSLSRLVAIYHTSLPNEVGPVRSVRTTDPDLLVAFGRPALMFSGGAGGPMDNFASSGLVDASSGVFGAGYFRSSAAAAPYNVHGNVELVAARVAGISTPKSPGFTFGADAPAMAGGRAVTRVQAQFANAISWTFVNGVWRYVRLGTTQTDAAGGATIEFQNLLVQRTVAVRDGNVDSAGSPSYKSFTTGSGSFTLYRDGKAIDGTWSRPDVSSPTSYVDGSGAPVLFKPGKTWVVLAPGQVRTSEG
jgi:Protein of unknown function (DUF3048) N-terminal domain/Protein of unknown function (DUF3048) C-terminal domain